VLGITVANDFAVTEHVLELTTKSAQTLFALRSIRVLRALGLSDAISVGHRMDFYICLLDSI